MPSSLCGANPSRRNERDRLVLFDVLWRGAMYPHGSSLEPLLAMLVRGQREALGDTLVGSYLFGSVVTGDFEPGVSDVDTIAVLGADLSASERSSLHELHRDIVRQLPEWDDRVEVVYVSRAALEAFRTERSPAARISPGEPFHAIEVDDRWLIDWYQLREIGVPLLGPPAISVVPDISHDDYVEAVRRHVIEAPSWVDELRTQGAQAYAILTMCRGLRTSRTGEYVSKREAARWASDVIPAHASIIHDALFWRIQSRVGDASDGIATQHATRGLIEDVVQLVIDDERAAGGSPRPR
jgi:aminoglycoside adenylyltransferase-like protein/nucleotidyltransferase-like protein